TSINSNQVIQFLYEFDKLNEHKIPHVEAVNHLGWVDDSTFISNPDESPIFLDISNSLQEVASAFHERGTFEGWIEGIRPYIEAQNHVPNFPLCRAVISSYFASVLLPIVGH
ncbi:DUF927 domain-containing protein, partial [Bacillus toyonensis]|nr:DUF927 domain-containing protein [Bacillus toyonensis]